MTTPIPQALRLAEEHLESGALDAAVGHCETVLAADPTHPRALWILGRVALHSQQFETAISLLRRAVAIAPNALPIQQSLAYALLFSERYEDVLSVVQSHENNPTSRVLEGRACAALGRNNEAETAYVHAINSDPDSLDARYLLGCLLHRQGRMADAEPHLRRAVALNPDFESAAIVLADNLSLQGWTDRARAVLDDAQQRMPEALGLRCAKLGVLPEVLLTSAEGDQVCARFASDLTELVDGVATGAPLDPAMLLPIFSFHYKQDDLLAVQRQFGGLLTQLHTGSTQGQTLPRTKLAADERIRVGFVSSHFRPHTAEWLFRGWIQHLDRQRFSVTCYDANANGREPAQGTREAADAFHTLPLDTDAAAQRILQDAPHVLIYPEVGMEANILCLAARRLAPLQCVAWAHPITTGLANMDWFLTSAAMEPPGAQSQYSETLICLPGVGAVVATPEPPPPSHRAAFSLPQTGPLLLSAQASQKYRPENDGLFARILKGAPDATLVLLLSNRPGNAQRFQSRIERSMRQAGLDPDTRCCFLSALSPTEYVQLIATCDFCLDPQGWSGGKTTFEATSVGTPVLTLPGTTMRSRHTTGILSEMGLDALIAKDADAYVDTAIQLARSPEAVRALSQELHARKDRVFGDLRSVRALESLFIDAFR